MQRPTSGVLSPVDVKDIKQSAVSHVSPTHAHTLLVALLEVENGGAGKAMVLPEGGGVQAERRQTALDPDQI